MNFLSEIKSILCLYTDHIEALALLILAIVILGPTEKSSGWPESINGFWVNFNLMTINSHY